MQIEVIYCPACRHKLRIPVDMLGTEVQCPECQGTFVAPPPPPGGAAPAATPPADAVREGAPPPSRETYRDERDEFEPFEPRERRAGAEKWLPACGIAMIIFGLLSLLASGLRFVFAMSPQIMKDMQKGGPFGGAGAMPPGLDLKLIFLVWGGLFCLLSLIAMMGGIALVRRRGFTLAVIGSIVSVINLADCCCIPMNALVGIAALIILFQPGVRASFR